MTTDHDSSTSTKKSETQENTIKSSLLRLLPSDVKDNLEFLHSMKVNAAAATAKDKKKAITTLNSASRKTVRVLFSMFLLALYGRSPQTPSAEVLNEFKKKQASLLRGVKTRAGLKRTLRSVDLMKAYIKTHLPLLPLVFDLFVRPKNRL